MMPDFSFRAPRRQPSIDFRILRTAELMMSPRHPKNTSVSGGPLDGAASSTIGGNFDPAEGSLTFTTEPNSAPRLSKPIVPTKAALASPSPSDSSDDSNRIIRLSDTKDPQLTLLPGG